MPFLGFERVRGPDLGILGANFGLISGYFRQILEFRRVGGSGLGVLEAESGVLDGQRT